jgi:O-antigen/teichoic acid export membrane protein
VSETPAVFRHSAVYAFAAVLNRGAGFLLLPLYTQFLEPSDYGVLGVIAITSEVVGAIVGVKLGTAMSRLFFDYAQEQEREELVSTAILGMGSIVLLFSVATALVADPVAALVLGNREQGDLLFLGIAGLLLNVVFTLGLQYLSVLQRSQAVLAVSTFRSVVSLGLGALFVAPLRLGVFGALLAILLANALAAAWLILPLLARLGLRFSRDKFIAMLRFGTPLLPAQLAELLLKFSDRYLLVQLASLAAVGVFFLGVRLTSILQMAFISPFNQIYIVRRFEVFGRKEADADGARVFTYFFAILVSVALALSLAAPPLVALIAFDRPAYYGAASVIPLLALAEVIRSLFLIAEIGIFLAKIPRYLTYASVAGTLIHVPLTAGMVAAFGVMGAAGAAVLSTTFRLVVTCRLARGLGGPQPEWGQILVILSAGIAVYGAAWTTELVLGTGVGAMARLLAAGAFPFFLLLSPAFSDAERTSLRRFVTDRFRRQRKDKAQRIARE